MNSLDIQPAKLPKRLSVLSLTGLHLVLVFNVFWCGVGAEQGSSNAVLWLLGIIAYYIPVALIVGHLSKRIPLEGGPYQWVRLSFGPYAGFLTGVNFFAFLVTMSAGTGLAAADTVSYLFPSIQGQISESYILIAIAHVSMICIACWINVQGFWLLKWITNMTAFLSVLVGVLLIGTLFMASHVARKNAFVMTLPPLTVTTFNIFTKVAFNALGGLEQAAVFSGESYQPERNVWRSVCFAAPLIAILYVLGTVAVLAHIPSGQVDLVAPVAQVVRVTLNNRPYVASVAVLVTALLAFVVSIVGLGEAARMPLVASWDKAVPLFLGHLHRLHGTPSNAILLASLFSVVLGLLSRIGTHTQEANQLLLGGAYACCGIYNILFLTVPLFGLRKLPGSVPDWLRWITLFPVIVTVAAIAFQTIALVSVGSRWLFALKVGAFVLAVNVTGTFLYIRRHRGV